jgi:hypothetical protein
MLTDILIASRADANQILTDAPGGWPRLEFRSLDNVALAGLWSALGAPDAATFEGEANLVAHTSDKWVFEFPLDFVRRLSALQSGSIEEIAAAWATHDELVHMAVDGPAVEPVVKEICAFARRATRDEMGLMLLMSL